MLLMLSLRPLGNLKGQLGKSKGEYMKKIILSLALLTSMTSMATTNLLDSEVTSFSSEHCSVEVTVGGGFKMEIDSGRVIRFNGDLVTNSASKIELDFEAEMSHHTQGEGVIARLLAELTADDIEMKSSILLNTETNTYEVIVAQNVNGALSTTKCYNLKKD